MQTDITLDVHVDRKTDMLSDSYPTDIRTRYQGKSDRQIYHLTEKANKILKFIL